jgi:small subunit ribosomal protein S20
MRFRTEKAHFPAARPALTRGYPIPILSPLRLMAAIRAVVTIASGILKVDNQDGEIRAMPNHKSAEKRVRQNEKRRDNNRDNRGRLRTSIKKLRAALTTGDANTIQELLPATISTIDKAVQKGVLHRNAAARYKSRLTTRVNQTSAK